MAAFLNYDPHLLLIQGSLCGWPWGGGWKQICQTNRFILCPFFYILIINWISEYFWGWHCSWQSWKICISNIPFSKNQQTNILADTRLARQQIKWRQIIFDSWSRKAALILTTKVATNLSVSSGRNILSQRQKYETKSGWIGLGSTIQTEIRGRVKAATLKKGKVRYERNHWRDFWQISEQYVRGGKGNYLWMRGPSNDRDGKRERKGKGWIQIVNQSRFKPSQKCQLRATHLPNTEPLQKITLKIHLSSLLSSKRMRLDWDLDSVLSQSRRGPWFNEQIFQEDPI